MDGSIIGGLLGVAGALAAAFYAHWTAKKANKHKEALEDARKSMQVEADVFARSRAHLDDVVAQQNSLLSRMGEALQRAQEEIAYLGRQMKRVQALLESEQNVSDTLRAQVRQLSDHFEQRADPLEELRKTNGGNPPTWPVH